MTRAVIISLSVLLTLAIVVIVLLSLFCFHCTVMDASCNALFGKYKLDPLIGLTADFTESPLCLSFKEMYTQHRAEMFKLNGNPEENAKLYDIRTVRVGPRRIRVFPADTPKGICIFIHGGGWTIGGYDEQDRDLVKLAQRTNQTVCSLDYRLLAQSLENKYPAAPNDCEMLSDYILSNAYEVEPRLTEDTFTICGNSAGAQLAMVVLLRLRDRYQRCPFARASFFYGGFVPQETTPQCGTCKVQDRTVGPVYTPGKDYKFLTKELYQRFQRAYSTDYLNPEINLTLADMHHLCPGQFIIGTEDLLLRCNVAVYHQWRFFKNDGELKVFKGQPHGFANFPTPSGREAATLRADYLRL